MNTDMNGCFEPLVRSTTGHKAELDLLPIREAGLVARIHPDTIRRWIREGQDASVRTAGDVSREPARYATAYRW